MEETPTTEIDFEKFVLLDDQSVNTNIPLTFVDFDELQKKEDGSVSPEGEEGKGEAGSIPEKKEEVVTTEEVKIAPKEEEKVITQTGDGKLNFVDIAKKLLDKGDWKDFIIENEDETETKLSEIENLDEETFLKIWDTQKTFSKEELENEYVSVKDIDENQKRLINIIANKGDIKEIFKSEANMKRPYEDVDLENLQTQQSIVYSNFLRKGLEEEEAKELTLKATKDLTLDKRAKVIVDTYQKAYDDNLATLEKEIIEEKKKEEENIKVYKKSLTTLFKEDGIEDKIAKPLIDAATKIDQETGSMYIDTVYEKLMKDPKEAKELVFFMLEKEKFLANKGASIKRETNMGTLKKIKIISETSKTATPKKEEEEKSTSPFANIVLE